MKKRYMTLWFLLASVAAQYGFAQIQSPDLLSEIGLEYPGLHDREALVELEFTVTRDGRAEDFRAVGGFYEQRFVDAVISAVSNARFEPAMENGEAVDWPKYRVTARFIIEDLFNTIQPGFNSAIRQVEELIGDGEYDAAEDMALDVLEERTQYIFEFAYINLRLSEINLLQGNLFEAAQASHWATQSYLAGEHNNYGIDSAKLVDAFKVLSVSQFNSSDFYNSIDVNTTFLVNSNLTEPQKIMRPPHLRSGLRFSEQGSDLGDKATMDVLNSRLMRDALQSGTQIYARLGHVKSALNDYQRYATLNSRVEDFLVEIETRINETLEQETPLLSQHRIHTGQALYYPTYRTFTVANVEGNLTAVDIQCERRVIRLAFQAGAEWQIPESWGNCALRMLGTEDTRFSVIEFM